MNRNLAQICMVLFLMGSNSIRLPSPQINQSVLAINIDYIPLTGTPLEGLIDGGEGEGLLVFLPKDTPSTYSFAVWLANQAGSQVSRAEIFQIPN